MARVHWPGAAELLAGQPKRAGLTQQQLIARVWERRKIKIDAKTMSYYVHGQVRHPDRRVVEELALALGFERARLLRAYGFSRPEATPQTIQQRYPGETFVTDSGFCALWGPGFLGETGFTVERDQRRYELPDLIKQVRIEPPPRHLYERDKARLVGLTAARDGDSITLRFQRASYSDYLKTNHQILLDSSVEWNGAEVVLADYLEPGGDRLRTLETAHCSNHLGLNALLIDPEDHAVLIARSRSYDHAYLPGTALGLSVAGSMDWTDSDPFAGMKREMAEELNLNDDMLQPPGLLLVAIARNAARGGKPEAFFVARTKMRWREINERFAGDAELRATGRLPVQDRETAGVFGKPVSEILASATHGIDDDYTPETSVALYFFRQVWDQRASRFRAARRTSQRNDPPGGEKARP